MFASKLANDVVIVLMNEQGKLTAGDNDLCVVFRKVETGKPADVQNVSIDFSQLVGRIQETPIKAQVMQDDAGYYRGSINLGRQYYSPASYYAIVRYIDLAGKKRRVRFHLTVK